uniref:Uncharacterized protein n=1 Tax=Rhizophora mucronata TaxID=61149 RepID=A0A2P2QD83_RHIMU
MLHNQVIMQQWILYIGLSIILNVCLSTLSYIHNGNIRAVQD